MVNLREFRRLSGGRCGCPKVILLPQGIRFQDAIRLCVAPGCAGGHEWTEVVRVSYWS